MRELVKEFKTQEEILSIADPNSIGLDHYRFFVFEDRVIGLDAKFLKYVRQHCKENIEK